MWPRRLALGVGPALLVVGFFALREATHGSKQPSADGAVQEVRKLPDSTSESRRGGEPKRPSVSRPERVTLQTVAEESGESAFEEDFADDNDEEDEAEDRVEQRLSAEVRLLENRRRAHDRLEETAQWDRLSAADRAALEARRASLSGKLALQEERVARLKQDVLSDEAGHEAQNGIP